MGEWHDIDILHVLAKSSTSFTGKVVCREDKENPMCVWLKVDMEKGTAGAMMGLLLFCLIINNEHVSKMNFMAYWL